MKKHELQALKIAWLAADEAGDTQAKLALLRENPDLQDTLIEFVAAYHVTSPAGTEPEALPMARRAMQTALKRVFAPHANALPAANLRELRNRQGLSLVEAARGLRLGIDVWKKFEDGLIELSSLGERQLARLTAFFQVTGEQFGTMLNQSQPSFTLNRRQTSRAARQEQQNAARQSFSEALEKSSMPLTEKQSWLDA